MPSRPPRALPYLLLLTALCCLPLLGAWFLADDFNLLLGLSQQGIARFALEAQSEAGTLRFWRPLAFALLGLQRTLFGWEALGYHLLGLGLHLTITALAFRFFARHLSPQPALLAAACFALHPRHAEAIGWISAQPDLWMSLFSLGFLLMLGTKSLETSPRWALLLPAICLLAALLSKEAALSLPLVAWALVPRGDPSRPRLWPFLALTGLWLAARGLVLGHPVAGYGAVHVQPGLLPLLKPLLSFPASLVFPVPLSWEGGAGLPSLSAPLQPLAWLWVGGLLVLGAVSLERAIASNPLSAKGFSAGGAWAWLRARAAGRFLLAFLLSLLPFYNLAVTPDGASDRYLYLPSLLGCGLLGLALAWLKEALETCGRRRLWRGLSVGLLLVASFSLLDRAMTYAAAGRLSEAVVRQVVSAARQQSAIRLNLAGVPDRLEGVGVLFTGLPGLVPVWSGGPAGPGPEVSIAARARLVRQRPGLEVGPEVRWDLTPRGLVGLLSGAVSSGQPAILPGGFGWPGFVPGGAASRAGVARWQQEVRVDAPWLLVEGARVRPGLAEGAGKPASPVEGAGPPN